jgi:hypothetical protein
MKRIRNICKKCGTEFTPTKGFWSICGVKCRGKKYWGGGSIEYTDIDSIKEFKRTEKLKKSNTVMDLKTLTKTYNTIYYLFNGDVITYLGKSENVNDFTRIRRIIEHYKNGKKFDKFIIRNVDLKYNINAIEAYEIMIHKPKENKSINLIKGEIKSLLTSVRGYITKEDERYLYEMGQNQSGRKNSINTLRELYEFGIKDS